MKTLKKIILILATTCWLASPTHGEDNNSKLNTARLAKEIQVALKRYYPKETIAPWAGYMAAPASSATSYDSLNEKLIEIFSSNDANLSWLKWAEKSAYLKKTAADIALLEFPGGTTRIPLSNRTFAANALDADANPESLSDLQIEQLLGNFPNSQPVLGSGADTNDIFGQISLWTGARFSNPYTIKGNELTTAGSSSDGYIELNLSSRYVLRQGTNASDLRWNQCDKTPENGFMQWVNPFAHMPDIDTRIGYLFRGSSAPTNYDSSTIVGTSDFYADTSIGVPLLRYCSKDNSWKQQVTLELNGGFSTDKDHLSLHPNAFVGLGWQASWLGNCLVSTNIGQGYWMGRAGVAFIDQPIMTGGTNTVQLNSLGQPEFNFKLAPTVGVIATCPLSSSVSLQAAANAYFTEHEPANWNISLGVSLDMSKFFGALLKQ